MAHWGKFSTRSSTDTSKIAHRWDLRAHMSIVSLVSFHSDSFVVPYAV